MKLLVLTTNDFAYNGITSNIYNYFKNINKTNIDIDFVVPSCLEEIKEKLNSENIRVFEMKNRKVNPIKYFIKLVQHLKSNKYDIIHCHGNSSTLIIEMIAAIISGIKIRIVHSRNSDAKHRVFHKIFRPLFKKTMTHKFACGQLAGEWMFGDGEFEIIRNGNDLDKYKFNKEIRTQYRKKMNIDNETIVLGHVGSFNYQKNHEYLIDVFNSLLKIEPNYKLVLIGDGPKKSYIEKKVKQLGIENKIVFIGQTNKVENYLQAMDIMLLTSHYEGLPNVVIEWQTNGLPCIISNNVTEEVAITSLVKFCSIDENTKKWVNEIRKTSIIDRGLIKDNIIDEIVNAGFDIKTNAKDLRKKYDEMFIKK